MKTCSQNNHWVNIRSVFCCVFDLEGVTAMFQFQHVIIQPATLHYISRIKYWYLSLNKNHELNTVYSGVIISYIFCFVVCMANSVEFAMVMCVCLFRYCKPLNTPPGLLFHFGPSRGCYYLRGIYKYQPYQPLPPTHFRVFAFCDSGDPMTYAC